MLYNWLKNSALIQPFVTPRIMSLEDWANTNAQITTPDRLIAGAIITNMAEHFTDWKLTDSCGSKMAFRQEGGASGPYKRGSEIMVLSNETKNLKIRFTGSWTKGKSKDGDGVSPWWWHFEAAKTGQVNDIPLEEDAAVRIWSEYKRLETAYKTAQEVAAKAKADMERNEAKWNLAESLLGMKRNGMGQLMPVCDCTPKQLCDRHKSEALDECIQELDALPVAAGRKRTKGL